MSLSVNTIKGYVDAKRDSLIGKAVVKAKSTSLFNLQTGVKGSAQLNLLTADATLQSGATCGWNAAGTTTVSKRDIKTGLIKVNVSFCDKDLIGTALQHDVKVAVGQKTLPFAEDFIEQNIKSINAQVEQLVWNGDSEGSTGTFLDLADGMIKILTEASITNSKTTGKTLAANTKEAIDTIVAAMPDAIMDREDLVIFVGVDVYRKYLKALQDANMYHYSPDTLKGDFSTIVPGTNVRVEGVAGLTGKNRAYATYAENFFYGTDLGGDNEKFDFWYSQDNREFRLVVEFNAGVQVAYPDMVVAWVD